MLKVQWRFVALACWHMGACAGSAATNGPGGMTTVGSGGYPAAGAGGSTTGGVTGGAGVSGGAGGAALDAAEPANDTGAGSGDAGDEGGDGGTSAGPFKHPGVLWNRAQLDFVRGKIMAGAQPWKAAFDDALQRAGALTYQPHPFEVVECGAYSNPNIGCSEERNDAVAAYTHALAWYVTRDEAHAKKAIEIMGAWARTLKSHANSNAPLQAAWAAAVWPLAGELIRHSYPGWAPGDVDAFATMLKTVYLASTSKGSSANGNWELVMIEATIDMAIFLDDHAAFDHALAMARKRIPAYFYLKSDGPTPVPPPGSTKDLTAFWYGQAMLVDGLAQETCRDFTHTQYGIASCLAIAEAAFQQGVDLYAEQSDRLRAAMEFHADYLLGTPAPSWLCGGTLMLTVRPTWEIGYNHFHDRLGLALPHTQKLIETKIRGMSDVDHHMVWETLTHAAVGWAGLK
jgi:hypothetical protein